MNYPKPDILDKAKESPRYVSVPQYRDHRFKPALVEATATLDALNRLTELGRSLGAGAGVGSGVPTGQSSQHRQAQASDTTKLLTGLACIAAVGLVIYFLHKNRRR